MNDKELRDKYVKGLQDFKKKSPNIIGGEGYYSVREVEEFHNNLLNTLGLNEIKSTLKLSTRKAAIIVIEEQITIFNEDRTDLYLEKIMNRVIIKYGEMVKQRDKAKLISIEHVHPKDPCIQFENKRRSLGEYYKALTFILANKYIIIRDSKVAEELENAKNKVIDCE